MSFYSFVVIAPQPVGIPKPFVVLDTGVNTFNAEVPNLDAFLAFLESEGVVVTRYYQLSSDTTKSEVPLLKG